jgi:AcrR family transcriptional regulator
VLSAGFKIGDDVRSPVPTTGNTAAKARPRGRPRLEIDRDAVADAVAELFHKGGYGAVSIISTAKKLSVSRATLYRTVATKEELLGILFERATRELTESAEAATGAVDDPGDQLNELIAIHVEAAVEMRSYMPVFFGGGDLPPDVVARWRTWSRQYEKLWVKVITANMERGYLDDGDPIVTARLILGALIWVSRWYRPREQFTPAQIAEAAIHLVGIGRRHVNPATRKTKRAQA